MNWFKRWFKKPTPHTYGLTTDQSTQIPETLTELSEVDFILNKAKTNESLSVREINLLLAERFGQKAITSTVYKLQPTILKDAIFMIDTVVVKHDEEDNVTCLEFQMKEMTFGITAKVHVSDFDFHDLFTPVDPSTFTDFGSNHDPQS